MRRQHGAEPAIARQLVSEPPDRSPREDRVGRRVGVVARDDEQRLGRIHRGGHEGLDDRGPNARLVTGQDDGRVDGMIGVGVQRAQADADRARQTLLRIGIDHGDRRREIEALERVVRRDHDHDRVEAGREGGIDHVADDRASLEDGAELVAAEP